VEDLGPRGLGEVRQAPPEHPDGHDEAQDDLEDADGGGGPFRRRGRGAHGSPSKTSLRATPVGAVGQTNHSRPRTTSKSGRGMRRSMPSVRSPPPSSAAWLACARIAARLAREYRRTGTRWVTSAAATKARSKDSRSNSGGKR